MRQDQAAERGDLEAVFGAFLLHIRQAKQQQWGGLAGRIFPVSLNGGDFGGLMLKRVQAVHIAHNSLDGGDQ